jgi:hypothetical protein
MIHELTHIPLRPHTQKSNVLHLKAAFGHPQANASLLQLLRCIFNVKKMNYFLS